MINQSHQFTCSKRKGPFMGELFWLRFFLSVILGIYRVVHPDLVSRFNQVVAQKAIAGTNHSCLTSCKVTRLVFSPSQSCEFSKLFMTGKLINITDFC